MEFQIQNVHGLHNKFKKSKSRQLLIDFTIKIVLRYVLTRQQNEKLARTSFNLKVWETACFLHFLKKSGSEPIIGLSKLILDYTNAKGDKGSKIVELSM